MSNLYVNFDDSDEDYTTANDTQNVTQYEKEYDKKTTEFYKKIRETKTNALMYDTYNFNQDKVFKFPHVWDPYTGGRMEEDPFGSLYFHPDELIYFFYNNRLNLLWSEPSDEASGFYQGYYGDGVGSGENIYIPGRGDCPELYLFRLPIDDCYIPPDADLSLITMGPKLTDNEIAEIDQLANKYHSDNYYKCYGKPRPSLVKMKQAYDISISETPDISKLKKNKKLTENEYKEYKMKANREGVDLLKKM
jgi:hypothetical protein